MEWQNLTRTQMLHAYMIPTTNLDDCYGEINNVDWASSSITCGYYTDTRTSGQLVIHGDEWNRNSFIRIVLEIPEYDYQKEIGTYAVSNDDRDFVNGECITTLELISLLHTMSLDLAPNPRVIGKGASVLDVIRSECRDAGREYIVSNAIDSKTSSVNILETGTSRLARCYELCSLSNNRLDVDGHGHITVNKYIAPSERTPSLTIDIQDTRGISFDDLHLSTDYLSSPSIAVISYQYIDEKTNENKEIVASVEVEAVNHGSIKQRGYNVTNFTSLTEMNPKTYNQALAIAKSKLKEHQQEKVEWTLTTKYLPIWEGDIVELIIPNDAGMYGGSRKCLVKSIDISCEYCDMQLTLKETASGDNDEE